MHKDRESVQKDIAARYARISTKTKADKARKQELIRCEVDIACGRNGYYDMGNSFRAIRDSKSYRIAGFENFAVYAEKVHNLKKSSVYRLIKIANLHDRLVLIMGEENMPHTAYALGSMLDLKPDQEAQVYELALEKAASKGEMVMAVHIKAAKDELGLSKPKLSAAPSTKEPEHEEEAVPVSLPAASEDPDEDDADEDLDEDDASESDDEETNSVNVKAKSSSASKLALAGHKFLAREVKARAAARCQKSKILDKTDKDKLFRARRVKARAALRSEKSKILDATDGGSKETSAEETAIELGKRMKKLGEEDIITQEVITPLLIGNKHVIMAYLDRASGSKYKRRLKDLLPCIDEVLTGRPREQDEAE